MPKTYRFKMVCMKFETFETDEPLPFDENLVKALSKDEQRRLKNARSSYKFTHFMDILTEKESEEVMQNRKVREEVRVESGVVFCNKTTACFIQELSTGYGNT